MRVHLMFAFGFFILSAGCKETGTPDEHLSYQRAQMGEPLRDVEVPEKLWTMFMAHFKPGTPKSKAAPKAETEKSESEHTKTGEGEHGGEKSAEHGSASGAEHGGEHGGGASGPASTSIRTRSGQPDIPREYIPIRVRLIEKSRGVLGRVHHELLYPKGGGELDLSEFVKDEKKGNFALRADFLPPLEEDEDLFVYFVSGSKKRKIVDEPFGSGCRRYFEITTFFKKSMRGEGFVTNTAEQRFVSLLAGTYYFVIASPGVVKLARLTVRDPRYPELQCGEKP